MSLWQIKAYYRPDGSCPIQDWYAEQDETVQARFDATLATLAATVDWTDTKQFKVLSRGHVGLGEVRFKIEEKGRPVRRFRPVGIWPPLAHREFILLVGCEKTKRLYLPPNAFALALELKAQLEAGIGEIHEYL
jgi:hypothetical protein